MKTTKILTILLTISLLSTVFAIGQIRQRNWDIFERNKMIEQFSIDRDRLIRENAQLSDGLKIHSDLIRFIDSLDYDSVVFVFYPVSGCFSCLEDLLTQQLKFESEEKNIIVYSKASIIEGIERLNDAYEMDITLYYEGIDESNIVQQLLVFDLSERSEIELVLADSEGNFNFE